MVLVKGMELTFILLVLVSWAVYTWFRHILVDRITGRETHTLPVYIHRLNDLICLFYPLSNTSVLIITLRGGFMAGIFQIFQYFMNATEGDSKTYGEQQAFVFALIPTSRHRTL